MVSNHRNSFKASKFYAVQLDNSGKLAVYVPWENTHQDISGKQDKITTSNKLAASLVSGLATVATSGKYSDLSGTPTIPSAAKDGKIYDRTGAQIFSANSSSDIKIMIIDCGSSTEMIN